jgi:hypothetical protein
VGAGVNQAAGHIRPVVRQLAIADLDYTMQVSEPSRFVPKQLYVYMVSYMEIFKSHLRNSLTSWDFEVNSRRYAKYQFFFLRF